MKTTRVIFQLFLCTTAVATLAWSSCRKDTGPLVIPLPVTAPVSFQNDIQPLFNSSCISCHNASHPYLQLDSCCSYYELLFTGTNAPYVDTLNPPESRIIKRMTGEIGPAMPLTGTLPQSEIDLVLRWIEEGAKNN